MPAQEDNVAIITAKQLTKQFTTYERGEGLRATIKALFVRKKVTHLAVNNVNFSIEPGEVVAFLGPNGAGKSTTIKMMTGILYPSSGDLQVLGFTPWKDRKSYVSSIGVVFGQKSQLIWDIPAVDSFHLHKSIFRIPEDQFQTTLTMLVELLELRDIMLRPVRSLSLGERMRCEFVMAMLHRPTVVFLDEPTIGLDVFAKETIRKFIKTANERFKTTFIITSHDLEDIEHLCSRVIVINHGSIVFDGAMDSLMRQDRKSIDVTYAGPVDPAFLAKIPGVAVTAVISDYQVQLEADTKRIALDKLIPRLRLNQPIEDLQISNPPLVEMIRKIYLQKVQTKRTRGKRTGKK